MLFGGLSGAAVGLLFAQSRDWAMARCGRLGAGLGVLAGMAIFGIASPRESLEKDASMISHFFIDRPIFASVCSIVFVLAGGVAVFTLPVAQYPEVAPPTVLITALYPGANAYTVRDTVAAPIEEQVNGVEGMMYMSSQSTNDGAYRLSVTFKLGMDSDMAQVLVQNRVSLALPVIPALVQNEGINVKKVSPNTMMIVNLVSPDNRYDATFLSNYATIYIRDELARLPGVADIGYLGQRDYSLRVWIDPDKLATLGLTAADVVTAIGQQNLQVTAGQIGQEPVPKGQQFQLTINTLGRLVDPEQFAEIIVKAGSGSQAASGTSGTARHPPVLGIGAGSAGGNSSATTAGSTSGATAQPLPPATGIVRLRDVARVALGSQQYEQSCTLDGKPSVALTVFQFPAPTPWTRPGKSTTRCGSSATAFRKASSTTLFTTPRPSSASRSTTSSTRFATQSSWWPWWCWPSCRTGERP